MNMHQLIGTVALVTVWPYYAVNSIAETISAWNARRTEFPAQMPPLKNGLPHGVFRSWHTEEQLHDEGNLHLGIPDGQWKGWYSNGQPKFIRHFSAYKYHLIRQEIKRDTRHVVTPLALEAKEDPTAFIKATTPSNSFKDLPVGNDPQALYTAPFKHCLPHGLYMNFYSDGRVKDSGYYKNGLRDGHWETRQDNGMTRSVGGYRHGHKAGTWATYDFEGKLKSLATYSRKGKLVSQKMYD
ncbi:toxin-antitoxin system YwqK family antitoxin [Flavihumibacter fluvii]|uniref:toxin-antitoxin system YwqK family antitoxin n=1 Tax=Flavihumibacter fluvii TaxID=2838157 RepID=UPI001BDDDD21|nr:hypothetical protein [Flavihumibacter fluvii]ULQ50594.1 hypothetical protein KJS93_10930 [Flavihumibacter fluvii]